MIAERKGAFHDSFNLLLQLYIYAAEGEGIISMVTA